MGDRAYMTPAHGERPAAPDSIDVPLTFGGKLARFDGMSARQLARRNPGGAQWCAESRPDHVGRLCAEALAVVLGVRPDEEQPAGGADARVEEGHQR